MLTRIIDFSLHHRVAVIVLTLAFAAVGLVSMRRLDIDAFPDITPVQIQVNTVVPQLDPVEVEQRVTYPVEQALTGMPKLENIRSISKFGLSQVVVTFEEGTDMLVARQLVSERLATVVLPPEVERPKMGPMSNGLGEVFHYIVMTHGDDRTKARTIHEWVIKPQIRAVSGVAEVNSWGGFQRQYQVRVNPEALVKYDLTFDQVVEAVDKNNRNVGGGVVHQGGGMLLVHGVGRVSNLEELRNIVVTARDGQPIFLWMIGEVRTGDDGPLRRASVTFDGRGEAMLGLGFMTTGENSHTVTTAMRERLKEASQALPRDVEVVPVYDRTELIDVVIGTAKKNLFEGGLLVVAVLFAFLGNLRAAFIVALAIPLSMLFAFTGMYRFAISASLLSLGAIDFGMIVDSSVVMVENCVRKSAEQSAAAARGWRTWFPFYMFFTEHRIPREVVRDAAVEVRQPTLFGELIILVVYLPVLTLEGMEGKMFRPMALTVIFALAGSMILSVTLMPVLASLMLPRRGSEREPLMLRGLKAGYAPVLRVAMQHKFLVLLVAAAILAFTFGIVAPSLGEEYMPRLSEGSVSINIMRPVGTKLETSNASNMQMEQAILKAFPNEVKHAWSRVGTADIATDPMGVELTDFYMTLYPRDRWKRAETPEELTRLIQQELRDFLGNSYEFTQPIEMRIEEIFSGTRGAVAIKLYGDDLKVLKAHADRVADILNETRGSEGVRVPPVEGQSVLRIRPRPEELAHHGIPAKAILDLVESIGGRPLGEVVEGQLRFPLVALLPQKMEDAAAVREIILATPAGEHIPLYRLADIDAYDGPPEINHERGQRKVATTCNVRDRDLAGFVEEAKKRIEAEVRPSLARHGSRYQIEYGGEYEQLLRAKERLWIVRGLALFLVVALLYLTYGNVVDTLRVLVGIPFALVGGVIALYLRDMPFSISAQIGFIAVAGVAVLDDMILVSYIRQLRQSGLGLDAAVEQAAMTRLRPVLMTTLVASLGFVPMAFSTGQGAEVQRPLATVVIGGVISALVMSLLVLRVLYVVLRPKATWDRGHPAR
ncbi:MAG TPA: CusA/CzcA family heavy metal efflux RND transporter [Gemmataceae bacterium]|nr:CusA/CzcA family heavy metal efflux RND transporter [Gemmataceae bacterium]